MHEWLSKTEGICGAALSESLTMVQETRAIRCTHHWLASTNAFFETDQIAAASAGQLIINGIGGMRDSVIVGYHRSRQGPWSFFVFIAEPKLLVGI